MSHESEIDRLRRLLQTLNAEYASELMRLSEKQRRLWTIRQQLAMVGFPLHQITQFGIAIAAPFRGIARTREEIEQINRLVAEYNELIAEIQRENQRLRQLTDEMSAVSRRISEIERRRIAMRVIPQTVRTEAQLVAAEEISRRIAELQRRLWEALRRGDYRTAEAIQNEINRLRRLLGQ